MSDGYVALQSMKVQRIAPDGGPVRHPKTGRPQIREVVRGEPIPEATTWPRVEMEIRAGRIALASSPNGAQAVADLAARSAAGGRAAARGPKAKAEAPAAKVTGSAGASSPPAPARTEAPGPGAKSGPGVSTSGKR